MREAARRKSAICGGVRDMETGGVEPNISMEDPHVENGWQNKRKPQSNPSTPRCLGKTFSRDGLSQAKICDLSMRGSKQCNTCKYKVRRFPCVSFKGRVLL